MDEEYISQILLELQPRSRHGYRRLFGVRENRFFNPTTFDTKHFIEMFLQHFNMKVVRKGDYIECENMIVAVEQINYSKLSSSADTQVLFLLRGVPFESNGQSSHPENEGNLNKTFIDDNLSTDHQDKRNAEQIYSCFCSQCHKTLADGEYYVKSGNWIRPIICLSCYELHLAPKCIRCVKPITFDYKSLTVDGLSTIHFVEHNNFYWHLDCCVCVTCLESLVGQKFYQDEKFNQLFCFEHMPC